LFGTFSLLIFLIKCVNRVCIIRNVTFYDKEIVLKINFVTINILVVTNFLFVTSIVYNSDKMEKNVTLNLL